MSQPEIAGFEPKELTPRTKEIRQEAPLPKTEAVLPKAEATTPKPDLKPSLRSERKFLKSLGLAVSLFAATEMGASEALAVEPTAVEQPAISREKFMEWTQQNGSEVLRHLDALEGQPFKDEVLAQLCTKISSYTFSVVDRFNNPLVAEHFARENIKGDAADAIDARDKLAKLPNGPELVQAAITSSIHSAPAEYLKNYRAEDGAKTLEAAARRAAAMDPYGAIREYAKYKSEAFAREVLDEAMAEAPEAVLVFLGKNELSDPQVIDRAIAGSIAQGSPQDVLEAGDALKKIYPKEAWEKAIGETLGACQGERLQFVLDHLNYIKDYSKLESVLVAAGEQYPRKFFDHDAFRYVSSEGAQRVFLAAVEKEPHLVLDFQPTTKDTATIDAMRMQAMENDPVNALSGLKSPGNRELAKRTRIGERLEEIEKADFPDHNRHRAATLIQRLEDGVSLAELTERIGDNRKYFHELTEVRKNPNALGRFSVKNELLFYSLGYTRTLNEQHEAPEAQRFAAIEGMTPEELYALTVYGEDELYTSSYNGIFNRLVSGMKKEGLDGVALFEKTGSYDKRKFYKLAVSYNRLDEFMQSMTPEQRQSELESIAKNLDQEAEPLSQAVTIAETYAANKDPQVREVLRKTIASETARTSTSTNADARIAYKILEKITQGSDVAKEGASDLEQISRRELFNKNGVHVQEHFFYSDEDGEANFQSFVGSFKGKSQWHIEANDEFVHITSTEGRKIEIFANLPSKEETGVDAFRAAEKERDLKPNMIVHRGHSYHVDKTIAEIQPSVRIAYLGSCGGYNNLDRVVTHAPDAQVVATKGTGKRAINNTTLDLITETIRADKDINWRSLWSSAEKRAGRDSAFGDYVPPYKNFGLAFVREFHKARYEELTK